MSRTGLDAATLAKSLRRIAGDGSAEWVMEPMQARVLLDVADALDERDRLRERVAELDELLPENGRWYRAETVDAYVAEIAKLRELLAETMMPVVKYAEKYGIEPSYTDVNEHIDSRLRELGVEVSQ